MKAVISIHDVSPYFQKEIEVILKELEGVEKSFLVTPVWNDIKSFDKNFFTSLAEEDLVVHGLTHKTDKRDFLGSLLSMSRTSCKEFYGLNEAETRSKIETAKTFFEDLYCRKPTGFIPPMWYHNNHSIKVIKEIGFSYTESATAFINLRDGFSTYSFPACFDFGNNKLLSFVSLFGWKNLFKYLRQSLVRLSIHPSDVKNGFLPDIAGIIRSLQSDNYSFLKYADLISD